MATRWHRRTTLLVAGCTLVCLLVAGKTGFDAIRQARTERRFIGTWGLLPQVWNVDPTNASLRGATLPTKLSPVQLQEFREDHSWHLWVKGARVSAEPARWRVAGDRRTITRESSAPSRYSESIWQWSFGEDDNVLFLRGIDVEAQYRMMGVSEDAEPVEQ